MPPDEPAPVRVVLLTSPGLFGAMIINRLAEQPGLDLVGIGFTNRVFKNTGLIGTLKRVIATSGLHYLAYNIQISNIAWVLLRLTGRPRGLRKPGLSVSYLTDVNSPESLAWLKQLAPDYVASYYFNQWIGPEVRATASRACVNMHPSLLPSLGGPDPVFRTLQRGVTTTGVTIHRVEDKFDAGHVLHQEERPVPENISMFRLFLSLVRDGSDVLARWMAGQIDPQPGRPIAADYSSFPTKADVREFFQSGHRMIRRGELGAAIREVR